MGLTRREILLFPLASLISRFLPRGLCGRHYDQLTEDDITSGIITEIELKKTIEYFSSFNDELIILPGHPATLLIHSGHLKDGTLKEAIHALTSLEV